ncbi:hypothetical protein OIV83_005084 [Microbotryomycetes sp. JL201]|nr:hypothetical protein OIV83_005084 [Microbotryomycetes sp. JL201]
MPQPGSSVLPDTVVSQLNKYAQHQSPPPAAAMASSSSPGTDRHYHHNRTGSFGHHRGHSHSSSFSSSMPFIPPSSSNQSLSAIASGQSNTSNSNATRILQLQNFSPDLKTKDIQTIFGEWEDDKGGFKIKWNDDSSCWIVFNDPSTAKRAYLTILTNPPTALEPTDEFTPKLTAYAGPETQAILQAVSTRTRSRSMGGGHSRKGSALGSGGGALAGVNFGQQQQQQQQGGGPAPGERFGHGRNQSFGRERRTGGTGGSFGQKQWHDLMDNQSNSGPEDGSQRNGNRSRPSSPEQGRRSPELTRGSWRAAENRSGSDSVATAVEGLTIHE